ncbi:MAG: CoB--CoM heterodisulfide reductase iron-sulfur subunit A family protein, partial [Planctomycetota bacterium]
SLIEKEQELGGNFRHIHSLLNGENPQEQLAGIVERINSHENIDVFLGARVTAVDGSVGNFTSTISQNGKETEVGHGTAIVAAGAREYEPTEYLYGQDPRVITQRCLDEWIAEEKDEVKNAKSVVMIQCVGSRNDDRPYCSRICCSQAIKNSIALKEVDPQRDVYVLYRDVRAYGFLEEHYRRARELGVRFIRYDKDKKPEVSAANGQLQVSCFDPMLNVPVSMNCDLLVLSAAIIPNEGVDELGKLFKVPLNSDKFFLEAHMKLRPVDFATDGVFMCGLAHCPKSVDESIAQADGAAARAATILSKDEIELDATISEIIDANCDGCAYCIDPCPYNALTLFEYMYKGSIKKTVQRDGALCKGCGVCMATCPKKGIFVRGFKLEQISSMVEAALIGE